MRHGLTQSALGTALIAPALLLTAAPTLAQEAVEVPARAEIIEQANLVALKLSRDGDFGQIAKPREDFCLYFHRNGIGLIQDAQGLQSSAPGSTPTGCAQFGEMIPPIVDLECRADVPVTLAITERALTDGLRFWVDSIVVDGELSDFSASSAGVRTFDVTCPPEDGGAVQSVPITLGFRVILRASAEQTGQVQATIPVELQF